ncbi:MAG: hypothetical protein WBI17_13930 [Clostridiaceae bacterium]
MEKSKNKELILYRLISLMFFGLFLSISALMLILNPLINYATKKTFLFSNMTLLLLDLLAFFLILLAWKKLKPRFSERLDHHADKVILIASIILLCLQLYISYHTYFATGWDVGSYVIPAAKLIASGSSLESVNSYFSIYPNNITLVWIFSELFKFKSSIPFLATSNDLVIIIALNCLISTLTGILTYKCVKRLTNVRWAVFSWLLYVLLIGLSPWMVITYSDALSLFFPILIFYIYTSEFSPKLFPLKWLLIGMLSFIGFYIRPQVVIMLIAIVIIEGWKGIFVNLKGKMKFMAVLAILVVSFSLSGTIKQGIIRDAGFETNEEDVLGWTHFAMMGLNDARDGIYSSEDAVFSDSFETVEERKAANLEEIKDRLDSFGLSGYLNFLSRKALVNYGDGTFAWSVEGGFYMETYEDKDPLISPRLKSFYYFGEKNYGITSTVEHAIWVLTILSLLGLAFMGKTKLDPRLSVLMLSLIGLTMFELIFEARARYLYIYAPIYLVLGAVGLKSILQRMRQGKIKAFSSI